MVYLSQCVGASMKLGCKLQGLNRTLFHGLRLLEGDKYGCHRIEIIPKRSKSQQLSYVHGVGDIPLLGVNIGHFVEKAAELYPDREAVVDIPQNLRKKFLDYTQDIDQLAMGMLSLKLNKGDRFGIWCPNRYEWIVAQLAAARAGLIMVPLNPGYQVPEMEYSIKKLEMRAVLVQESFRTQDYYKLMTKVVPEIANTKPGTQIKSSKHPYFDTFIMLTDKDLPGVIRYGDVTKAGGKAEQQQLEALHWKIQCDDPASVQFTSGTTGAPKGVILSHHNLVNGCHTMQNKHKYKNTLNRFCLPAPLFHAFGCLTVVINMLQNGQCLVLPSQVYNASDTLKAITNEKCTAICGTPTMFIDMLNHPEFSKTDFSAMKKGLIGGSSCPPHLIQNIMQKMNCPELMIGYGATEISAGVVITYRHDIPEEKLRSCGWVYDYLECKITDENGCIVPIGTAGEICVRGYKVMQGYWGDEEKTKESITKDGWYKTGDLGLLNETGTLSVTGRIKDMILRGGENVYPSEIEDFLITHPKIADAQVVGVPDERLGEQICAWVMLKLNQTMTEVELRDFCKDKIAHYKIPYYIRFVQEMPKTLSGKVLKYVIKEEMVKSLGIQNKT